MFLRSNTRVKDGKEHRYYTVVESRRLQSGKVAQRQVLYLGEINDSQQAAWRRTLEVFDEAEQRLTPLSLFPEDRPVPADAIDSVQVDPGSEFRLHRQWFDQSAMDVLLGQGFAVAEKDRLCRFTCSSSGKICSLPNSICCCTT